MNHTELPLAGRLGFNICSHSLLASNIVTEHIPVRTAAAMFQKDPPVLIARPGMGNGGFAARMGIGAMTAACEAAFRKATANEDLSPKGMDVPRPWTSKFVDRRVGMEMQRRWRSVAAT